MAVFNSTQIANGVPIGGVGEGGAQLKAAYFSVDIPAGATTTDTINLGFLPPNAIVHGLQAKYPAFAGSTTLNVGNGAVGTALAAGAATFLSAQSTATAGSTLAIATTGLFFKNTTKQRLPIVATFQAGTVATGGLLEVAIEYKTEEPQQ